MGRERGRSAGGRGGWRRGREGETAEEEGGGGGVGIGGRCLGGG